MKRNIAIFLTLMLFFGLIYPALGEKVLAQADTETTTIDVINSKTVRTINDGVPEAHEPGEWSPSYGAHINYMGYDEDAGDIYEEESILQFDLDKVSDKIIVSAKLKFDVLFGSNADWGIWASDDNVWESGATIPDKTRLINNGTGVEGGVNSIDVTSFFTSEFNGAAEKATFIISHTDPSKKGSQSYFAFYSMGENLPGSRQQPTLEVTYLANHPPIGQIEIVANEDHFVNHRNVFLQITGEDLDGDPMEINISNSSIFVEEEWKPFESPHRQEWELLEGDGLKTVYMQLRDAHGNRSDVYEASVTLDTTKPTGSVTINNGAEYTTNPHVTLVIEGIDDHGVAQMRFSNQAEDWSSSTWVPYATTHGWTLDASDDGEKTVYMLLQDKAGNPSELITSNIILLDTKAPQGTLEINSGATHTKDTKVQLTLTADDGNGTNFVQMKFSNNNQTWSSWEPFEASKEWYLAADEGQKTVYMKLRDAAGNESEDEISGSIYLDITSPTGSITVNGGAKYTNSRDVKLSVSADDGGGVGDIQVQFSNDEQTWSDDHWLDYDNPTEEYDWQLTEGDSEKSVYMKLRDSLGNESTSAIKSDSIILDTIPPTVTGVADGEIYSVDVTIGFDEGTATLNGAPFANGTTVSTEGSYTLIVTDAAGNITTVEFVIDKTAPIVTGVADGGIYNVDVTIAFNEGTATLNGVSFVNGATVSAEGSYTLIVTDAAGNITTVEFMIDKTAPIVTGVVHDGIYNVDVTIEFNEGTATLNGAPFVIGETVSTEGSYTLIVTDAAGNITTVEFVIDKTAPVITGVMHDGIYNVDVTIEFNEGTATLNGASFISGTTVSAERSYILVVSDAAGNITTVEFVIDKTAPIVTGVADGGIYNVDVTIEFNEGTATLNGAPFVNGATVSAEGSYTLIVTDAAGNITTVEFVIDKTPPTGTVSINNGTDYTNTLEVALYIEGEDSGTPNSIQMRFSNISHTWEDDWEPLKETKSWTLDDNGISEKTVYMQLRDEAGNVSAPISSAPITYKSIPVPLDLTVMGKENKALILQSTDFTYTNADETELDSIRIVRLPDHGELSLRSKKVVQEQGILLSEIELGELIFTPNQDWHGTTELTWNAGNGYEFSEAAGKLTIELAPVIHPPIEPIPDPPSTNPPPPPKEEGVKVKVEGISQQALGVNSSERHGLSVLRIRFTDKLFLEKLEGLSEALRFNIISDEDILETELTEEQIEFLIKHKLDIEIVTSEGTYLLPLQKLDFRTLKANRMNSPSDGATTLLFRVAPGTESAQTALAQEAKRQGFDIVKPIVSLYLLLVQEGKEYPVSSINKIVSGLISIPRTEGNVPTTAVIVLPNGTLLSLPTKVITSSAGAITSVSSKLFGDIAFIRVNKDFKDMDKHWAREAVERLASRLILNGRDTESFAPNDKVNRAEFTAILARALGLWTDHEKVNFADVQTNVWYEDALQAVLDAGLIEGYADQTFRPQQEITREEASVIFSRALKLLGKDVSLQEEEIEEILQGYTDQTTVKSWSREAVALSIKFGLMAGENQSLSLNEPMTRAQLAVMFDRFLRLL